MADRGLRPGLRPRPRGGQRARSVLGGAPRRPCRGGPGPVAPPRRQGVPGRAPAPAARRGVDVDHPRRAPRQERGRWRRAPGAGALWAYMEGARLQTGMNYRLENRLLAEPDESVQDLVYRIAQEALDNVRRHARAEHVEVLVATREGGVFVRVWDDGLGFTAQEVLPEHSGLVSMRERAQLAGGWCRVQSLPALGTKVEFWLPVAGTATSEPAIETIANWSA